MPSCVSSHLTLTTRSSHIVHLQQAAVAVTTTRNSDAASSDVLDALTSQTIVHPSDATCYCCSIDADDEHSRCSQSIDPFWGGMHSLPEYSKSLACLSFEAKARQAAGRSACRPRRGRSRSSGCQAVILRSLKLPKRYLKWLREPFLVSASVNVTSGAAVLQGPQWPQWGRPVRPLGCHLS